MLKLLIFSLLTIFIVPITFWGQNVIGTMEVYRQPKLQLNAKILNQQYCSEMDLVLELQLTFTNIGKEPIILDKKSDVVYAYQEEPLDKSAKKHLRQKRTITPTLDMKQIIRFGQTPDENAFIVLNESESYNLKIHKIIDVYDGTDDTEDFLHSGKYNLILKVKTWYYPISLTEEYSQKWRDKGFLWVDGVSSEPIEFEVLKNRTISDCSGKNPGWNRQNGN
jgi:hypothetical protein